MKRSYDVIMKQVFLSFFFVLPLVANADAIEIDGIYYNLSEKDHQANVTINPNKYQGDVTIPESVTYEGVEYAVKNVGEKAFYRCYDLKSVAIPNSVIGIGQEAFEYCGITSVIIPDNVYSIGERAFYGGIGITSVTISKNVNSIGSLAFADCSFLASVYVDIINPLSIDKTVFANSTNATLYVPYGKLSAYESADNWTEFQKIMEAPGDVNGDGIIDAADALSIANYSIDTPNTNFIVTVADADNDGEIDIADGVHIINYTKSKAKALNIKDYGASVSISPVIEWESNKKVTYEGIVYSYFQTGYSCSNPIEVFEGDVVEVVAKSHYSASIISKCRANGSGVYDIRGRDNVVEPLVVATDANEHAYTVTITEHSYIMVCVVPSNLKSVTIKRENSDNCLDVGHYIRTKYAETVYDGNLPFNPNADCIQTYYADNKNGSGSSAQSNYIVNAVVYPNGEIIACRNGGAVVKILNDGTEVPIQYNGADMIIQNASDWRGVFISKNNDVFISPHSSLGKGDGTPNGTTNQIGEADRGLYRIAYGSTTATKVLNLFNNAPVMVVMWAENTSYTVGKIVWYINHCYKCNIAHTSSSTFDASKFERMPNWKQNKAYKAGDIVQINNNDYECIDTHTSGSAWNSAEQNYWVAAASCMRGQHDTVWSMCEDDKGDLYAGVYAHLTRRQPVIYKSHDRGIHWRYIYNFATNANVDIPGDWPIVQGPRHIHGITFNEYDNCLYCACGETNTLWKSSDYGFHWEDLKCAGYEGKPTSVIGVPGGVVMGSDGQWGCAITKVLNDGRIAKLVGKIWASFIFNIRRSDRTGWLYAFARLDNVIQNKGVGTSCPPVEAMTDANVLEAWINESNQNVIKEWREHNTYCSKYYPEDAIIPHHGAIMVSKDDGDSWEILRYEDVGTNGSSGFVTAGYFRDGECLTGLVSDNGRESGNIFIQPVVISEGNTTGEIFIKTNRSE